MTPLHTRHSESKRTHGFRHSGLDPESSGAPLDSGFRRNDGGAPRFSRAAVALGALLLFAIGGSSAQPSPQPASPPAAEIPADPAATYKDIDLKKLVANARTEIPGQRIIFAPTAVRFRAVLAAMPAPQKTDYLKKALGMMGVSGLATVTQRIGLDYGGEKALAAYIDDAAAVRLAKDAKPGQPLQFYAYHVYNHARGPALVVTSFSQ